MLKNMERNIFNVGLSVLLATFISTLADSNLGICEGLTASRGCSCNLTSAPGVTLTPIDSGVVETQLDNEYVDWRLVILSGLTGLTASGLVVIGISLVALWKNDQKITPNAQQENPRPNRPALYSASSSSDSWATPRQRASPIAWIGQIRSSLQVKTNPLLDGPIPRFGLVLQVKALSDLDIIAQLAQP